MQQIEVRIKGNIEEQWSNWFGGLAISHPSSEETVLKGTVPDQAALYGIISRLRDLGLELVSVSSQKIEENLQEG